MTELKYILIMAASTATIGIVLVGVAHLIKRTKWYKKDFEVLKNNTDPTIVGHDAQNICYSVRHDNGKEIFHTEKNIPQFISTVEDNFIFDKKNHKYVKLEKGEMFLENPIEVSSGGNLPNFVKKGLEESMEGKAKYRGSFKDHVKLDEKIKALRRLKRKEYNDKYRSKKKKK